MLRIPCPFCGVRDHSEFTYLGDAQPQRPAHQDQDAKLWFDYVYLRDNPCGKIAEYWQHLHGCREWLVVWRDTQTHEIFSAELARDFNARRDGTTAKTTAPTTTPTTAQTTPNSTAQSPQHTPSNPQQGTQRSGGNDGA